MPLTPQSTLNDGGVKFVRQTISLGAANGTFYTYIVKEGSMDADVTRITAPDQNNVENKQAFSLKIAEGSLTLSFVNPSDEPPVPLQSVQILTTSGTQVKVIIGKVAQKFGAGEDASVTCSIYAQQSATPTT